MCGGHGNYRVLGNVINEALDGRSHYMDQGEYRRDARAEIEHQVKLMYARGEIDSGTYHRLVDMAQSGDLRWEDLNQIEKVPGRIGIQTPKIQPARDAEIVGSLNQLYTHRKQLESARRDTQQVLETLEKEAERLAEQAKIAQSKAEQSLDNDDAARAYLDTRHKALQRENSIRERIDDLHRNLSRIENLEADLSTREAELKALESGEQLTQLEASIRQDLLTNE